MKKTLFYFTLLISIILFSSCQETKVYHLKDYGVLPNTNENVSPLIKKALEEIAKDSTQSSKGLKIVLEKGTYHFYPEGAFSREYYISNHDQTNPKTVGIVLENFLNLEFLGNGSELIFHERMLPISLTNSENTTVSGLSIDFNNPQISQVTVKKNDTINKKIALEVAPWVRYKIENNTFIAHGDTWKQTPFVGIAFEENTKHLVYRTSDVYLNLANTVTEIGPNLIEVSKWDNKQLIEGTRLALRSWDRPNPGVFLSENVNTSLKNIKVHYAEGMGLLAQLCENITLDYFSVCLKGDEDERYFTTQADATHFSSCYGTITSNHGLYEGMMDDAINVHGTYLKITKQIDSHTVEAQYMHPQSYGFQWGRVGDSIQFISASTMEIIANENTIKSITTIDKPDFHGAKVYQISFDKELTFNTDDYKTVGIENLTLSPSVIFSDNLIRNNRARGTLFSTPKSVLVENNVFDHTSGTAILLCGDCNGWYETGACTNVVIKDNVFINALTNPFQFTNAIISIYPEIPDLKSQKKYFHSNIIIENNVFKTFDTPIVYAKSVDGLIFRNNVVETNSDYPPFHWNQSQLFFERVINAKLENNIYGKGNILKEE